MQLVELLFWKDPAGQVRTHVPCAFSSLSSTFARKYPGKHLVHWALFKVEATLKSWIPHFAQLGVTVPQAKEIEFSNGPTRLVER